MAKIVLKEFVKELELVNCCYVQVVMVMVTVQ